MIRYTQKIAVLLLCVTIWSMQAMARNWITSLRDDVYVHQLSIPGAHDAGTGEGFEHFYMSSFASTQDVSLQGQWDSGIRVFDLRPTAVQKGKEKRYLKIYHGKAETKIRFDEAMRFLCEQVENNPGEFAIVVMRHEKDGEKKDVGNLWEVLMDSCLNAEEFKNRLAPFRHDLTVGEMRGKVLVLSRDMYLGNKRLVGGYITRWSHSADIIAQKQGAINGKSSVEISPLYIQDFYNCSKGKLSTKLATMDTMFRESAKTLSVTTGVRTWVINHTSGYTKSASANGYRRNAVSTNQMALRFLSSCKPGTPMGIVMMDFAGVDKSRGYEVKSLSLTQALVDNNKPYEK